MGKCPWYTGTKSRNGSGCDCPSSPITRRNDMYCKGMPNKSRLYEQCPHYLPYENYFHPVGPPCPQCYLDERSGNVYCMSSKNPKTNKGQELTQNGVDVHRCAEGRQVKGKKYTQCRYYTRGKSGGRK